MTCPLGVKMPENLVYREPMEHGGHTKVKIDAYYAIMILKL